MYTVERLPLDRWTRLVLSCLGALAGNLAMIASAAAEVFPERIALPDGFRPEGITIRRGTEFFVGSIPNGAIYRGDLRTGEGEILAPGVDGRAATGLSYDPRSDLLFVSGAGTGKGFVYDAETGDLVMEWQFASAPTFINDVVVTENAVYFTDSQSPLIYAVPLGPGGELDESGVFEPITLGGDFEFVSPGLNTNGIEASANGKWLIIVNSTSGELYRVDPTTGDATRIDVPGGEFTMGDGILLQGRTLYVVRNRINRIEVVQLDSFFTSGVLVQTITNPNFRVPTTLARLGNALYAVNARFDTPPTPTTDYDVVRIER